MAKIVKNLRPPLSGGGGVGGVGCAGPLYAWWHFALAAAVSAAAWLGAEALSRQGADPA